MSILKLRDYQDAAVQSLFDYFSKKSGDPLIAMPTGTGKSVVIAGFLHRVFQYPSQKVMIVTHVKELITQNYNKLISIWHEAPAGIYSAGLKRRDTSHNAIFCGIGSVAKRAAEFGKVDILIIDEAHLVSPDDETNYRKFIAALRLVNPQLKVIGLTATPWRMGHGSIVGDGSLFTDMCFDLTTMHAFNWFISEGYLSTLIPKNPSMLLDLSEVGTRLGEYREDELQLAVDKDEITRRALTEAMEFGKNRNSWCIFASGINHAINCAAMLTELGIECKAVHSKMTGDERDGIMKAWFNGSLRAVANNNVLTTGVDHPMLDFIVDLRPTKSVVLQVQKLGRGTRPVYAPGFDLSTRDGRLAAIVAGPKQNCLVLDFSQNVKNLGPINDPVIPKRKGEAGGGVAPSKLCPVCSTWNHATARECMDCEHKFVFTTKYKDTAGTMEIIKQSEPIVETFAVDQITYSKHAKIGKQPSMKVNYYCGLRSFMEFVPLQLQGSALGLAKRWWSARSRSIPMPVTVDEALEIAPMLSAATHLRVWTNKHPYVEIMGVCFDGTNFGTETPSLKSVKVSTNKLSSKLNLKPSQKSVTKSQLDDMDDDIPF